MDKHKQSELDLHIKNTLTDGEATPPEWVWDHISKELYPQPKRKTFWWVFFALVVVLLSAIMFIALSYKYSPNKTSINKHKEQNNAPNNSIKKENLLNPSKNNALVEPTIKSEKIAHNNEPVQANSAMTPKQTNAQGISTTNISSRNIAPAPKILSSVFSPSTNNKESNINSITTKKSAVNQAITHTEEETAVKVIQHASPDINNKEGLNIPDTALADNSAKQKIKRRNNISLFAQAGFNYFNQAVYNTRLSTGALNTAQKSENKGYQYGIGGTYALNRKQSIGLGLIYNQKYSYLSNRLHVSPSDFLNYHYKKQLVPLENLDKVSCDEYFFLKDFVFEYEVRHYLFQLGYTQHIVHTKKWDYDLSLIGFSNMSSSVQVLSNNMLSGIQNKKEHFSFLGVGIGNSLSYHIGKNVHIGIAPQVSTQLLNSKQSVFAKHGFEIVVPIRMAYHF